MIIRDFTNVITIQSFKAEIASELESLTSYWLQNAIDETYGGFVGVVDYCNKIVPEANKGIILNTRILWSFSALARHKKTSEHLPICNRAYEYLKDFFLDKTYGGVYWEVDVKGYPVNKRKQVYAQVFAIYAFTEYYLLTGKVEAKNLAISIFELIEEHARDRGQGGYTEAMDEQWGSLSDMCLSEKDMNAAKTMNTHLHVLEAYTNLLKVYDNDELRQSLKALVGLFTEKFLSVDYRHHLFFDESWMLLSQAASYGHDIEAAWLVLEAVEAINDPVLTESYEKIALNIADSFLNEAIALDGAVLNEKNLLTQTVDTDRHWWVQAEAMLGLIYLYRITPDERYISTALRIWDYTKNHLRDKAHGEWYFRVDELGKSYSEDKISMWKAPYHVFRSCINMIDKL